MDNNSETFSKKVIEIAKADIGNTEIKDNGGWVNKKFEAAMRAIGWMTGWAWCASWVRKVYLQAADELWGKKSENYRILKKALSHGVLKTWRNMTASPYFVKEKGTLHRGDIGFYDHGKGKGHEIIFTSGNTKEFNTIEGNTNKAGAREGKYVMRRKRKADSKFLGFMRYIPVKELPPV